MKNWKTKMNPSNICSVPFGYTETNCQILKLFTRVPNFYLVKLCYHISEEFITLPI